MKCKICGNDEHDGGFKCPLIKAYEYYPILDNWGNAIVKRVEFITPADFYRETPTLLDLPAHSTRQ